MRGWREEENSDVVVTMSRADWNTLLISLGYATGGMGSPQRDQMLRFVDRLNVGNPHYVPYQKKEGEKT